MRRERNTKLVDLFALTGWSKGELARLVNRRAAGMGHPQLATDTSRVRRWLEDGECPRDPVPRVLAALFTERLGRVVTSEDLGLTGRPRHHTPAVPEELPWSTKRTVDALTEFTGMDLMLNRRGFVGTGFALVAGPVLVTNFDRWLAVGSSAPGASDAAAAIGPPRAAGFGTHAAYAPVDAGPVGADEVAALEHAVTIFRAWDANRGGGLQRKAVVGQLNEVGNLLTADNAAPVRQRLWAVAANLSVLAGWMSHDVGLNPTAQNYFVIGAHAAREAGDLPRAAEALSRAARQMVHLGRPRDALSLIELAQRTAGERATPTTRAMFHTVEAWAQASLGRSADCRRTLGLAEREFTRSQPQNNPDWIGFFDDADLHGMQALIYRTLAETDPSSARPAQEHAEKAMELRAQGHQRSQTFDLISLASAYLLDNQPDAGARYARLAIRATGDVSSHRTWDRLAEMRRLTGRYKDVPEIRRLHEEIADGGGPAGPPQA
ncbi:hypothetical protein LO772_27810 [Yinghuangia sp. ASG 101]|uniref:DNA-binding protein NsdB n=1 Tax=Yinghuangia sp. ASG 101 TaxID=2896848 RepID=UPI001E2CF52F|nr:hypothetical protein [Yinghuangia sp. ASG 101]UGQ10612.1 hypothetical protein LO772_27810 [Yinghuangia sp. ASG 101]